MKVLLLHAYSAANAGDGLLVEESIELVREALGPSVQFTVCASHPETFGDLDARVVSSALTTRGYSREYLQTLRRVNEFNLVVGVGGGYLRAGGLTEGVKSALIHGPQLFAASRAATPSIYLPQSIGPAKAGISKILRRQLKNLDRVFVRDDRSMQEFGDAGALRTSDLAILGAAIKYRQSDPSAIPVVSARPVRGVMPPLVTNMCEQLGKFDGYVQSETSGNDDRAVMEQIGARQLLSRADLMESDASEARVVVAVRLHAALMALRAGHYVIHLAYERKGFGAFSDLGLSEYVHNVSMFEPNRVVDQVGAFVHDAETREKYRAHLNRAMETARVGRSELVRDLRRIAMSTEARCGGSESRVD